MCHAVFMGSTSGLTVEVKVTPTERAGDQTSDRVLKDDPLGPQPPQDIELQVLDDRNCSDASNESGIINRT